MASFARRRPPAAWSVDDASTFAALKEFKLLQLLSADKKASLRRHVALAPLSSSFSDRGGFSIKLEGILYQMVFLRYSDSILCYISWVS